MAEDFNASINWTTFLYHCKFVSEEKETTGHVNYLCTKPDNNDQYNTKSFECRIENCPIFKYDESWGDDDWYNEDNRDKHGLIELEYE